MTATAAIAANRRPSGSLTGGSAVADVIGGPQDVLPNGSRLSCGRNAHRRKAVEPQTKRLAGEATQFFPQGARQLQAHVRRHAIGESRHEEVKPEISNPPKY